MIHEVAHGWVALKCGDPTARDLGRLTLDPIPHIDLWMTILLPALLWFGSGGRFIFGGAKPVPVSFHRLRHPYRDMAVVALAGPASNFLIATFLFLVYRILVEKAGLLQPQTIGSNVIVQGIVLNLLLAAFNLLPVPPLDGSRVMAWLLPESLRAPYVRLESVGLLLIVVLLWVFPGVTMPVINQAASVMWDAMSWIVSLGGLW